MLKYDNKQMKITVEWGEDVANYLAIVQKNTVSYHHSDDTNHFTTMWEVDFYWIKTSDFFLWNVSALPAMSNEVDQQNNYTYFIYSSEVLLLKKAETMQYKRVPHVDGNECKRGW